MLAIVRPVLLLLGIFLFAWTIAAAARIGLARVYLTYALATGNQVVANEAVRMSPKDPDTHRARSSVMSLEQPAVSASEIEQALALRSADYALWVDLGLSRDQAGDTAGALTAFDEAIKRAPFYATPRWQRGNLLLRLGQYDAAFADLNYAAESSPDMLISFIDLAWNVAHGDAQTLQRLVHINTKPTHLAMAMFLANHGKGREALTEFQATGSLGETKRLDLIKSLLRNESFVEAYQVWSNAKNGSDSSGMQILDGGFESTLGFDEDGFGWRIPGKLPGATVSLDSTKPHSGSKNLRIEFSGGPPSGVDPVSQLVIVEPLRRYRLSFAGRSQDIVSGSLPIVAVTNAGSDVQLLGKSASLPKGTSDWNVFSFEFTTPATAKAVMVRLQRENCTAPCPIFGAIFLDSFSLEQLGPLK